MAGFRPMSHDELMAPHAVGEDAVVLRDVVEPMPRGPHHQPRLRAGTRVRVHGIVRDAGRPRYVVEACDGRARPSGWWALVRGSELGEAPAVSLLDWLRSRLTF